jgi:hypothetical protein
MTMARRNTSKYATLDALIVGSLAMQSMTRRRLYTHGAGGYIHREIRELDETAGLRPIRAAPLISSRLQSLAQRGWVKCSPLNNKWYTRAAA